MTEQGDGAERAADRTADLRLGVLDGEDLAVVSAHLQHAETSLADMAYLPKEKRFALVVARFDWPLAAQGRFARRQAGLHFERVLKAARSGFPASGEGEIGQLLAITFEPRDAPGGLVRLAFAGGAQIRLTVECLEAEMRDLGPRWEIGDKPASPDGAAR